MAYTGTLVAGGHGNFKSPNLAHEADGVEVDFITVDYINAMNGEVTHPYAAANTAGLHLAMEAIQNQGVNILGKGVLSNSILPGTTTVAAIQAAVRALDALTPDKVTATISSATAADRDMGDTSVGA
jgi:hypothetical protein